MAVRGALQSCIGWNCPVKMVLCPASIWCVALLLSSFCSRPTFGGKLAKWELSYNKWSV